MIKILDYEISRCCGGSLATVADGELPRCTACGHRQPHRGVVPVPARSMAPWTWPAELLRRRRAVMAGRREQLRFRRDG